MMFVKYIFDTGVLVDLKRHYFSDVFVSLMRNVEGLISSGSIISSSEVYKELSQREDEALDFAKRHRGIFLQPTIDEMRTIIEINEKHPELVKVKNLMSGRPVADPFVIAQARHNNATLITQETFKPNSHNIPNVCNDLNISCTNLRGFFELEDWKW